MVGRGTGVTDDRLAALGWLRTLGRVSPVIDADAVALLGSDRTETVRVLGVDVLRDQPFRSYRLVDTGAEGRPPSTQAFLTLLADSIAIVMTRRPSPGGTAWRWGAALELAVGGRAVPLVVRGLLGGDGPASLLDGNFALMDIAAAQLALGRLGEVDRVDIQLGEGIDVAAAEQAVGAPGCPRAWASSGRPGAAPRSSGCSRRSTSTWMPSRTSRCSSGCSSSTTRCRLVIARRAEIGMLRTVGTSRRLVLALFLGEAPALGVCGCALGAPLGWRWHGAVG